MAVIKSFERGGPKNPKLHRTQVVCHWSVFRSDGAGPILQLDTMGSDDREHPGKISQTLQLTPTSAAELVAILRREYRLA
jgi:hypothetical protein